MAEKTNATTTTFGSLFPVPNHIAKVMSPEDCLNVPLALESYEPAVGVGNQETMVTYFRTTSGERIQMTWGAKSAVYAQLEAHMTAQQPDLPLWTRIVRYGKYYRLD